MLDNITPEVRGQYRELCKQIDTLVRESGHNVREWCQKNNVERHTYYRIVNGEAVLIPSFMHIVDALGLEIKLVKKGGDQ